MFWKKKKKVKPEFACAECGEIHSNWPALAYKAPDSYLLLKEEDTETMAEISSDFCVINWGDETSRFIRAVLLMPVLDAEEDLDYGLWVSLSEKSFADYTENYHNPAHEAQYFGWLNSFIDHYEDTINIPMTVVTQPGNSRPLLYPHRDHDHPLVRDFYQGITAHEAQRRVDDLVGRE